MTHAAQQAPSTQSESFARVAVPWRWRVDDAGSSVTVSTRGFWGLARTTVTFTGLSGAAELDAGGRFSGELVIPAATLSTGLAVRDHHLRGRDFFDVERYPEIRFAAERLIASAGRYVVRGLLSLRDQVAGLELPVELAERPGDRLALTAHAVLEREPLGLGRSPLGMIRGPAVVRVDLMLSRSDRGSESPNSADDGPRSRHPDSPPQADRGENVVEIPRVGM
jgi:polyisoprenoid-binding protein YceI